MTNIDTSPISADDYVRNQASLVLPLPGSC